MGTLSLISALCFRCRKPNKTLEIPFPKTPLCKPRNLAFNANFSSPKSHLLHSNIVSFAIRSSLSTISVRTRNYEFSDGAAEVELRIQLGGRDIQSSRDVFVDINESSLTIRVQSSGSLVTLMEADRLYEKIKPSETIWYIDEDQLVVNLKKLDIDLKWPDITETWESLTTGVSQLLKGTSIYVIGDSTEINQKVAKELGVGLRYTPLSTSELLETFAKQSIDSCEYGGTLKPVCCSQN